MIFKNLPNSKDLESYKERNLYYKFFAGYYFNELVPDESSRKIRFLEKLEEIIDMNSDRFKGDKVLTKGILNGLKSKEIQVTFDYHSAQIIEEDKRDDRGEMSDVLLFTDSHFISIECKFLEDMKIKKDIETVQQRIVRVKNKISKGNEIFPIQILLMVKKKWENSKAINSQTTFYKSFQDITLEIPAIIMFWEDLISLVDDEKVKLYMEAQIKRKR